jgi:hypothetical protein
MHRYIVLDKGWYRPGFQREDGTLAGLDGLGAFTTSTIFPTPPYFGDGWEGKLGALQARLSVALAGVNAADEKTWDAIWSQLQGKVAPGTQSPFTGWGWTRDAILRAGIKLFLPHTGEGASSSYYLNQNEAFKGAVQYADRLALDALNMVEYYTKISPETAAAVARAAAEQGIRVGESTKLADVSQVGWDTFWKEFKDRGENLLGKGMDLTTVALIVGGLFVASRFVGR